MFQSNQRCRILSTLYINPTWSTISQSRGLRTHGSSSVKRYRVSVEEKSRAETQFCSRSWQNPITFERIVEYVRLKGNEIYQIAFKTRTRRGKVEPQRRWMREPLVKSKFPDNVTNHRFALQIEIQSYSVYNPLERLYTYVRTLVCVCISVYVHVLSSICSTLSLARKIWKFPLATRDFGQNLHVCAYFHWITDFPKEPIVGITGSGGYQRQGTGGNRRARSLILAALNIAWKDAT